MHDPQIQLHADYIDYRLARDIEDDNVPRSRAQRRRDAKRKRPAANPKWVNWTIHAMMVTVAVALALALLGVL
jgi:hypothetical protein